MTQIKIISNPYKKRITYQRYEDSEHEWENITENAGYSGKLKADKLIHGFFPFAVKEIVDDIIDEYDDSREKISLFFEGTGDEYNDMAAVCREPETAAVIDLQPLKRRLNNAWEVLPRVVEIFDKNVRPIVGKSISGDSPNKEKVESDLEKYADASNDIVPICVIGNYSAGKSTFINALIGNEILPSGDKAVTARIFKIYQSKDAHAAEVIFTYDGETEKLYLSEDGFKLGGTSNEIAEGLRKVLSSIETAGYSIRVNKALAFINSFVNAEKKDVVGSVIEIHIPFRKGLWADFPGKYVILDTPGSNAASHADHKAVLTEAMEGMSNGIPIYVAEYDSLDSTDNESLYDIARQMEGLDPRFTMIVVNKADAANLPKEDFSAEEKDAILHESIPKHLYSSGIYFVSSIMGLGAKNGGSFIDDHCDETFGLYQNRFTDDTDRHYKQLYKYDIMPDQIKPAAMQAAAEEAGQDKLFVNSGFYSVEHAIQTFSTKYASYNKCQQSELFLDKVIDSTGAELKETTERREAAKKDMEEKLEADTQKKIAEIEHSANEELLSYEDAYENAMQPALEQAKTAYTVQDFKVQEAYLTREHQKNLDVDSKKAEAKKQAADVGDAVKGGFRRLRSSFSLNTLKEVSSSVLKETKEAIDSSSAARSSSREADRQAASDLISQANQNFCAQAKKAEEDLDKEAREYWTECSEKFRERLAEVVKNSTLSQKKKDEITEMIVDYEKLNFDSVENGEIFTVDEFDYLLNLGNIKLFKMDKLFLSRLTEAYAARLAAVVDKVDHNIHDAYINSFTGWEENLVNVVRMNIVDYSPELKAQQRMINAETEKIHGLQNMLSRLELYAEDIHAMTAWQEEN